MRSNPPFSCFYSMAANVALRRDVAPHAFRAHKRVTRR